MIDAKATRPRPGATGDEVANGLNERGSDATNSNPYLLGVENLKVGQAVGISTGRQSIVEAVSEPWMADSGVFKVTLRLDYRDATEDVPVGAVFEVVG